MSDSAESVVRNYLAAWQRSDLDLDELVSFFRDDALFVDGERGTHKGVDAIKAELQSMAQMVSGLGIAVKALAANGGTVMVERVDTFEFHGKQFGVDIASVFEVDSNNRIKRWRDYYDLRSLEDRIAAALAPTS